MMVNADIGKVKVEIGASEDEEIENFGKFAAMVIITVCRIENERKKLENISE